MNVYVYLLVYIFLALGCGYIFLIYVGVIFMTRMPNIALMLKILEGVLACCDDATFLRRLKLLNQNCMLLILYCK